MDADCGEGNSGTRKISRKKFVSKRVAVLIKERKALQRELKRETCQ